MKDAGLAKMAEHLASRTLLKTPYGKAHIVLGLSGGYWTYCHRSLAVHYSVTRAPWPPTCKRCIAAIEKEMTAQCKA